MQTSNELISVIITVYNLQDFISECIDSIINQSYYNLEIIIIDDGSEDKSWEIITKYSSIDKRIISIKQPNKGVSHARNLGISMSQGSLITFVDGDDILDHKTYEYAYISLISDPSVDFVQFPIVYGWMSNNQIKNKFKSDYSSKPELLSAYLLGKLTFSTCDKLFRKTLFDELRFTENIRYEDFNLFIDLIHYIEHVKVIDQGCYYYRYRSNSFTAYSATNKREYNYLDVAERINSLSANFSELLGALTRFSILSICQVSDGFVKATKEEIANLNKYKLLDISFKGFSIALINGYLNNKLFIIGISRLLFGLSFTFNIFSNIRKALKKQKIINS